MPNMPEKVQEEWENRSGPVILTTVNENGMPNAIYASCVSKHDNKTIVVADNFFDKTKKNIHTSDKASILFITDDGDAYQLKGKIAYHTDGEIYEAMKEWNPDKLPGHAAAALTVEEVYSGADQLL